jgi:hypothetical protein
VLEGRGARVKVESWTLVGKPGAVARAKVWYVLV